VKEIERENERVRELVRERCRERMSGREREREIEGLAGLKWFSSFVTRFFVVDTCPVELEIR